MPASKSYAENWMLLQTKTYNDNQFQSLKKWHGAAFKFKSKWALEEAVAADFYNNVLPIKLHKKMLLRSFIWEIWSFVLPF